MKNITPYSFSLFFAVDEVNEIERGEEVRSYGVQWRITDCTDYTDRPGDCAPAADLQEVAGGRKRYENAYFITRSGFANLSLASIGAAFRRFA